MKKFIILSLISFSASAYENCTGENITALEKCSYDNYKSEDNLLNYLYKTIITSFPEIKNEVKSAQILWIKTRDGICKYSAEDGVEYKISQNVYMYQQTYERNRELKAIIMKEANKGVTSQSESQPEWKNYIQSHCEFMEKHFSDDKCKDRNQFLHADQ